MSRESIRAERHKAAPFRRSWKAPKSLLPQPKFSREFLEQWRKVTSNYIPIPEGEPETWTTPLAELGVGLLHQSMDYSGNFNVLFSASVCQRALEALGYSFPNGASGDLPIELALPVSRVQFRTALRHTMFRQDDSWAVAMNAVVLAYLGDSSQLPTFIGMLNSNDDQHRHAAAQAIALLSPPNAIPLLATCNWVEDQVDSNVFRLQAIDQLNAWEEALPLLKPEKKTSCAYLKSAIEMALEEEDISEFEPFFANEHGRYGEVLLSFLGGRPKLVESLAEQLSERIINMTSQDLPDLYAAEALGSLGESIEEYAGSLLENEAWGPRYLACIAIGQTVAGVRACKNELERACRVDQDGDVRREAAFALLTAFPTHSMAHDTIRNSMGTRAGFLQRLQSRPQLIGVSPLAELAGLAPVTTRSLAFFNDSGIEPARISLAQAFVFSVPEAAPLMEKLLETSTDDQLRRGISIALLSTGQLPTQNALMRGMMVTNAPPVLPPNATREQYIELLRCQDPSSSVSAAADAVLPLYYRQMIEQIPLAEHWLHHVKPTQVAGLRPRVPKTTVNSAAETFREVTFDAHEGVLLPFGVTKFLELSGLQPSTFLPYALASNRTELIHPLLVEMFSDPSEQEVVELQRLAEQFLMEGCPHQGLGCRIILGLSGKEWPEKRRKDLLERVQAIADTGSEELALSALLALRSSPVVKAAKGKKPPHSKTVPLDGPLYVRRSRRLAKSKVPPPRFTAEFLRQWRNATGIPVEVPPGDPSGWTNLLSVYGPAALWITDISENYVFSEPFEFLLNKELGTTGHEAFSSWALRTSVPFAAASFEGALRNLLSSEQHKVRGQAALASVHAGLRCFTEELLDGLSTWQPDAVPGVAEALGLLGERRAIPILAKASWGEEDSGSIARLWALEELDGWIEAKDLLDTTSNHLAAKVAAAMVAAAEGNSAAVGGLLVKEVGSYRLPILRRFLRTPSLAEPHVDALLVLITEKTTDDLADATGLLAAEVLGSLGESAFESLLDVTTSDNILAKLYATIALGVSPAHASQAEETLWKLMLTDGDAGVQQEAALALLPLHPTSTLVHRYLYAADSFAYDWCLRAALRKDLPGLNPWLMMANELEVTNELLAAHTIGIGDLSRTTSIVLGQTKPEFCVEAFKRLSSPTSNSRDLVIRDGAGVGLFLTGTLTDVPDFHRLLLTTSEGDEPVFPGENLDDRAGAIALFLRWDVGVTDRARKLLKFVSPEKRALLSSFVDAPTMSAADLEPLGAQELFHLLVFEASAGDLVRDATKRLLTIAPDQFEAVKELVSLNVVQLRDRILQGIVAHLQASDPSKLVDFLFASLAERDGTSLALWLQGLATLDPNTFTEECKTRWEALREKLIERSDKDNFSYAIDSAHAAITGSSATVSEETSEESPDTEEETETEEEDNSDAESSEES